jgi:hypothetical protein
MGLVIQKKSLFLLIFLGVLSISFVSAYPCVKFQFFEQGTNVQLTNIEWRVWACGDSTCTTINPSYWYQSGNSGSNNYAYIKFKPNLPPSGWYVVYFYPSNYISTAGKRSYYWTSKTDPNSCDQYSVWDNDPINNPRFFKASNCNANFTSSIQTCAEAGLPLTILTDTKLDTQTASYFKYPNFYYPSEFNSWINATTKMSIDIKKQGSSSSVTNFPQNQQFGIYASTTYPFSFLWQTSQSTDPGDYIITMTSTVPDTKCDQSTMIPTTKTMTVHIAESLDGCRAEIQNFNAVSSGSGYSFTGKRLTEYQDWNYQSIDSCNLGNPTLASSSLFDTAYTLTIYNDTNKQQVYTTTGVWTKGTAFNTPLDFSIPWNNPVPGNFIANLTISSSGATSTCNGIGVTAKATTTITNGHDNDNDGYYDNGGDCNDNDPLIYSGAVELCDTKNNDCDAETDEGCSCINSQTKQCSEIKYGICATGTATCTNGQWVGCPTPASANCTSKNSKSRRQTSQKQRPIRDGKFKGVAN